jgi:outer membrane protein OmpA-like peptidoglycan-associated protein
VKSTLVTRYGIDASRLAPQGYGETRPRASNETPVGRADNRRVELVRLP